MKKFAYILIVGAVLFWLVGGIDSAIEKPSMRSVKGAGTTLAFHALAINGMGAKIASQFSFEPFTPSLPDHMWMDVGMGEIRFFQFDKQLSEPDAKLIFMGEGIRGKFCASDQPQGGKTGFVHFHRLNLPDGAKMAHGGNPGDEGYWLRHIAVGGVERDGIQFSPGIAMNFMSTPPPAC